MQRQLRPNLPVSSITRLGVQTGALAKALANNVPSAASRSRFGVRTGSRSGAGAQFIALARIWSAKI